MTDTEKQRVLIIGNSDGIGLALTERLLARGLRVIGLSRSPAPVDHEHYQHHVVDVCSPEYAEVMAGICRETPPNTCVYCAGIGQELDVAHLQSERQTFQVNLMGAVIAIEHVLPSMLDAGAGHIIGLSSQADVLRDPGAPSYAASKAGMSSYLEGLARAVRKGGVHVTNVRFGFVDTKMAKAETRPFMITADKAARLIEKCMHRRPVRFTHPWRMAALLWVVRKFT